MACTDRWTENRIVHMTDEEGDCHDVVLIETFVQIDTRGGPGRPTRVEVEARTRDGDPVTFVRRDGKVGHFVIRAFPPLIKRDVRLHCSDPHLFD